MVHHFCMVRAVDGAICLHEQIEAIVECPLVLVTVFDDRDDLHPLHDKKQATVVDDSAVQQFDDILMVQHRRCRLFRLKPRCALVRVRVRLFTVYYNLQARQLFESTP